jgi:hypothetical protein
VRYLSFRQPQRHGVSTLRRNRVGKMKKRSAILPVSTILDARRQPRFSIEVDIKIDSRTCGMLKGHTVDISESGIAAHAEN